MKINLSNEAQLDLQEISNYTWAEWGAEQERKYLTLLYQSIHQLESTPLRIRDRSDLYPGCKLIYVGKHSVFFRIEHDTVHVSRILHQAMDPFRHDFPE